MLCTQLPTLKLRLGIDEFDVKYDTLLTNAITTITTRFDNECNGALARTVSALHEFPANDLEILPPIYPIEAVTKFELKENETDGWTEQTDVEFLIRQRCIISLNNPLSTIHHQPLQTRVTYTGATSSQAKVGQASRLPPPPFRMTWNKPPSSKSPPGSSLTQLRPPRLEVLRLGSERNVPSP